ncbi:MAG: helix-turn-helix domain-containing protein [Bdellovibrionales bacterium]|nr:helix-turn-helix domain-containing protein [Bdellovibrionales bacterium]
MADRNSISTSLGEFLRLERERRGVTIEQMVSATKISVRMIQALESDHYADLPAKPFIRGFVVSYCRFLGIPSHEVLTRFSPYLEERAQERPKRDTGHSGYAFEKKEGDGGRTGLWILMGTMLVGGALMIAIFKPTLKRHRKSHVEKLQIANPLQPVASETKESLPVADLPVPPEKTPIPALVSAVQAQAKGPLAPVPVIPSSAETPPAPAVPTASPTGLPLLERKPDPMFSGKDLLKDEIRVKVVVKALEDVWVRFQVDQKQKNRLVLREGVVLVLFAKDFAALQVSNPAGVQVARSAGPPQRLQLLHGERPLVEVLDLKQGVSSDGRTLMTIAQGVEGRVNPFDGEPALPAPPPRPQRKASETPVKTPDLSTP